MNGNVLVHNLYMCLGPLYQFSSSKIFAIVNTGTLNFVMYIRMCRIGVGVANEFNSSHMWFIIGHTCVKCLIPASPKPQ